MRIKTQKWKKKRNGKKTPHSLESDKSGRQLLIRIQGGSSKNIREQALKNSQWSVISIPIQKVPNDRSYIPIYRLFV